MARYVICEKCKRCVEYITLTKNEGGTIYTSFTCPECGYIKNTNKSYIHYGNDKRT